jgi:hypothetical protein
VPSVASGKAVLVRAKAAALVGVVGGGAALSTLATALAVLVGSATLVAVRWNVVEVFTFGAVNIPEEVMVPPEAVQVTAGVPALETKAVN